MGLRFYKRVKIAPGITMNISKSGASFSFGPKGMKYTVGPKGTRTTFGIPGTGLYYTTSKSWKSREQKQRQAAQQAVPEMGFLRQLFSSPAEKRLMQGFKEFLQGNKAEAYNILKQNSELVDSIFMCGIIALGRKDYAAAEGHFLNCYSRINELGQAIGKISSNFEMLLEITEFIEAPVGFDRRGLALAIVEAYQHQNKYQKALDVLTGIWNSNPSDKVICLSLTDLIANSNDATTQDLKDIIELTSDIENDEPIDTNILYLRSYILYRLGLVDAAIQSLTTIKRKKKDRPEDLMLCIQYMRGRMLEEMGQVAKAKKEYQSIYAKEPRFEDVARRLGLY